jgi:hypothetical protein
MTQKMLKSARKKFPQNEHIYELIKHVLATQIQLVVETWRKFDDLTGTDSRSTEVSVS